jgi:adenine-specific DNA-methyltransferase
MPYERLKPSFVFDEERLKQLKQIAPEAFTDGKINWDILKEALGEYVEDESQEVEHFGLFWPGKREARKLASIPSKGSLVPVRGEGIDEDKTRNIFIEGENLEVLKLLQKSYAGRIKMIYIDPPYNTGNDFIYDDNFTEPLEEYLKYTGQMDEEGRVLTTNTKADGRFHSRWLSMMYPRLRLARNLLTEDGVIFISIDDNEVAHLKKICDEIFGEECFIGKIIIKSNPRGKQSSKNIAFMHEYLLIYSKNIGLNLNEEELSERQVSDYKYEDRNGKYRLLGLRKRGAASRRIDVPSLYFPIYYDLSTKKILLERVSGSVEILPKLENGEDGRWRWSKGKIIKDIDLLEVKEVKRKGTGNIEHDIFTKDYLEREGGLKGKKVVSIWDEKEINYEFGKEELRELFGKNIYDYPKTVYLLKKIIKFGSDDNDIILDFFAGSGMTGHAVLDFNIEPDSKRKFICIQLPELCEENSDAYKAGYKTIAEICKDRLLRVIKLIRKKQNNNNLEVGLKVFKLEKSNFKQWQDYQGKDLKELQRVFEHWQSPLIDDWKEEDLLIEILLQEGFPLDSKIEQLGQYSKNKILQVSSEFCEHKLLVCLDKKVYQETINDLALGSDDRFICLDNALNDEQKVRLSDKGFLKTI